MSKKYSDFLGVVFRKSATKNLYCLSQGFFFDSISTSRQLSLYFKFIKLLKELFDNLRDSKRESRHLTPRKIRYAIFRYYQFMEMIKRVRKLYQEYGVPDDDAIDDDAMDLNELMDDIKKKKEVNDLFPINDSFSEREVYPINCFFSTPESFLEFIVKRKKGGGNKKESKRLLEYNWYNKASDIAFDLAAFAIDTSPGNLKQIFKKEKNFCESVRKYLPQMKTFNDFEKVLTAQSCYIPSFRLKNDVEVPADVRKEIIRYTISNLSNAPPGVREAIIAGNK